MRTVRRERSGVEKQIEQLDALIAVGQQATVMEDEERLLQRAIELVGPTFGRDVLRVGLLRDGVMEYLDCGSDRANTESAEAAEGLNGTGAALILPLEVKGHPVGVLEIHRPRGGFAERERTVLRSFAKQLSITVDNARRYQQLDGLLRSYLSPAVAASLIADPGQATLGGALRQVTVLFADLQGFTAFAERTPPDQVVESLNRYYGLIVPVVLEEGGTVVQFVGDEIMALFNAPVRQPDHALRAARAGLRLQQAVTHHGSGDPWEQPGRLGFRVGVNTGVALVGNIGSTEMRNYTAIGDTTNLAARLQAAAEVGQVLLGPATYAQIHHSVEVRPVGPLVCKGKTEPVLSYALLGLCGEG